MVVPPNAGVVSAYGLLASDYVQFESVTNLLPLDERAPARIRETYHAMRERAAQRFGRLGFTEGLAYDFVAEMRFVGQAFEVPVEIAADDIDRLTTEIVRERFEEAHRRLYFHGGSDRPAEAVSFRLGVTAPLDSIPRLAEEVAAAAGGESETHTIFDQRREVDCTVCGRASFGVGDAVEGPYLLEDSTSTIYVPDGWTAAVDSENNLVLTRTEP